MRKIRYVCSGHLMKRADAAYIGSNSDGLNLATILADQVTDAISTEVIVKLGETEITLAMLQDPDHWADDWEQAGVEDVDEFLAGFVEEGF